jgi:O-antigen/teichoic acid export membrane protein
MTSAQVKKNVVKSTVSGYARTFTRMALGLVTFRLLYQGLSTEQFGFWSLLWAIFGYGILLDFGFGYAAQKRVAELSVKQDWDQLSRVLSSIVGFYCLSAAVAVLLGIICSGPLVDLFKVSPENRESFRVVLMVFLAGIGLAFPLGIFPEILQGQQRMVLANNLSMATTAANFCCVVLVMRLKLGFLTLVVLALACVVVPYLVAAWLAFRHMPGVRLRPAYFSRSALFQTSKFSVFAYLNMLGNVMRNKADQPVISSILGVAAVAPYQAGGKIGDMFGQITRQIADVLSPTAAHLHAKGDTAALRQMLIGGMRFSILAATPLYVLSAAYMDGLIRLLTGVKEPGGAMLWVGHLLLLWYYSLVLTHWVFKRMFFMAGQERRMMWQGVTEASCNLALSIGLTFALRSVTGVALGSVIPTMLFGWGLLWGWAAKEAQLTRWGLFCRVVLPAWRGCLPMVILAVALRLQPFWASGSNTFLVLAEGAVVGAVGLAGLWRFGLTPEDREKFASKLAGKLRRRAPAPAKA